MKRRTRKLTKKETVKLVKKLVRLMHNKSCRTHLNCVATEGCQSQTENIKLP